MPDTRDPSNVLKDLYESDRSEDPEVRAQNIGKELVNRLFMLYRTGRVHSMENDATKQAMEAVQTILKSLMQDANQIALTSVGESFYLNRILLKVDFSAFENFRFLSELFVKLNISGLTFLELPSDNDLRAFLKVILKGTPYDSSPEWLSFPSIRVLQAATMTEVQKKQLAAADRTDSGYLLRLYLKGILSLQTFIRNLQKGELTSVSRLQRIVHDFVDASGEESRALLALVSIHSKDEYLAYHSLNVCLLSLLVGRALGMSKRYLSDLGTASLLHDIGKVQISQELLEKTVALAPEDWVELKKSNTYSLLQLIQLRGFNEAALRRMLVAYEHTLDLQGKQGQKPTLFARIVAIAHCYDAMVTEHSYRDAMMPGEALKLMKKEEGTKFDAILLQVFIKLVSPYPPGTLVLLESKEVGVVTDEPYIRQDPLRPHVNILYSPDGRLTESVEVDTTRDRKRAILKALDPSKVGINPCVTLFPSVDPMMLTEEVT